MRVFVAGIDPGVQTGLALWDEATKTLVECQTTTILEAMWRLDNCLTAGTLGRIQIEDARLIGGIAGAGRERLQGAGSVKRDCSIWQEWAERNGVLFVPISPRHKGAKIGADHFVRIAGWSGRTSQHARDAAVIAMMRGSRE